MISFFLWITKKYVLKSACNQTNLVTIDFQYMVGKNETFLKNTLAGLNL